MILFRLFVAGDTARSHRAIENLRLLCRDLRLSDAEIDVVDVVEHPDVAEAERILTTPTLVKAAPPPVRRVIGDLSDRRAVLEALTLEALTRQPEPGGAA